MYVYYRSSSNLLTRTNYQLTLLKSKFRRSWWSEVINYLHFHAVGMAVALKSVLWEALFLKSAAWSLVIMLKFIWTTIFKSIFIKKILSNTVGLVGRCKAGLLFAWVRSFLATVFTLPRVRLKRDSTYPKPNQKRCATYNSLKRPYRQLRQYPTPTVSELNTGSSLNRDVKMSHSH